jgi:hypothetical protein
MEKLDIIETTVYCYNEQFELVKILDLSQFQNVDFDYLKDSKLFSFNVNIPIKRVVKFTEINDLNTQADFVEYPYADMTPKEQSDFDSFVSQAEAL